MLFFVAQTYSIINTKSMTQLITLQQLEPFRLDVANILSGQYDCIRIERLNLGMMSLKRLLQEYGECS